MSIRRLTVMVALLGGLWPPTASSSPGFLMAVRENDLAAVERHLAKGVASNVLNASLYHAVSGEMVGALVAGGAALDVPVREGSHALPWAIYNGKTDVARALINAGSDVNALSPRHRYATLNMALWPDSRATLRDMHLLIEAGADVNRATRYGFTPLHLVAKYGRDPNMIDLLLNSGADPLARRTISHHGDTGKTPLDLARKYNPRILRSEAGRRLEAATRRAGMNEPGCDGVVVQPSDTKLSYIAQRTLGKASRWKEIVELNGLEGKGYRTGDCLALQ